jgi:hypothetical protein
VVQFKGSGAAAPEFIVVPEWWGGRGVTFSDALDLIAAACAGARCRVVLMRSYGLDRPWRVTPNLFVW